MEIETGCYWQKTEINAQDKNLSRILQFREQGWLWSGRYL